MEKQRFGSGLDHLLIQARREHDRWRFLQGWRREVVLRWHQPGEPGPSLGDPSCRFSARSVWVRCAVNPLGPCQGCSHYQP